MSAVRARVTGTFVHVNVAVAPFGYVALRDNLRYERVIADAVGEARGAAAAVCIIRDFTISR